MELNEKVALVTGAARGIGRTIALRFAAEGAAVALTDINAKGLENVAAEARNQGATVYHQATDITGADQVTGLVDAVASTLGPVDILVNDAAICKIRPFLDTTEELWDATMAVNLKGMFLCCRAVIPGMLEKGGGRIINLSSQSGRRGSTWHAAYCASKFGVVGLTQSLAVEFGPRHITVNAICPGVVPTPAWEEMAPDHARREGINPDEWQANLVDKIPLGRLGTPEDIAELAVFLASSRAAYITGQAINVSGGSVLV